MCGLGHQHVEVGPGAGDHRVELRIAAVELRALASDRAARLVAGAERRCDGRVILALRVDQAARLDHNRLLARLVKIDVPARIAMAKFTRRRIEVQPRNPGHLVEAEIAELEFAVAHPVDAARAAVQTPGTAHLEQIGEVGVECDFHRDRPPDRAITAQPDPLERRTVAQKLEARQMYRLALEPHPALGGVKVGVGQIDHHRAIIVKQNRAKLKRLRTAQPDGEFAQEARVPVEQSIGPERTAGEIALTVEHREQIIVLERAKGPLDQTLGRFDVVIVRVLDKLWERGTGQCNCGIGQINQPALGVPDTGRGPQWSSRQADANNLPPCAAR